jgi:hypothetical protein
VLFRLPARTVFALNRTKFLKFRTVFTKYRTVLASFRTVFPAVRESLIVPSMVWLDRFVTAVVTAFDRVAGTTADTAVSCGR